MLIRKYVLAFIISITTAVGCGVNAEEAAFKTITSVEGITEYHLSNGLQVLLFPDPTKETVTVNVTYRVGSKHENYGETGMAHLLEHLVFKGTPKHPDIPAELSKAGARPNGTTWTDRTNYFETFSATDENINWALSMESDRMVNSFIRKEDLDSEMTVVRNEFERGENSPFRITLQKMTAAAYEWHNYGKTTIGARSDIENVSIDRLKAFYKKYYQPDNATLIVAGKFESKDMLERINKYFGAIPKPTRVLPEIYTVEPAQAGEKQVTVRRVGDAQFVGAAYHIPAGSHPDFAAIEVLTQVLANTPSGRLHKTLVEGKLASRTYGFNFQWQDPGIAIFFAELDKSSDISNTTDAMLAVIENIAKKAVTEDEVSRAKSAIIKNIELSFNSSQSVALQLSEWLAMGDWRLYFLNRDRVEAVTTADVQRVAEAYLQRNNRTLGRFIPTETPERVEIPQVASVAEMLEGFKGREDIAQGELFDPSFDNIDARTENYKFDNGMRLSMLNKKTRGESVNLSLLMHLGDVDSLNGKQIAGNATGTMLMRGAAGMTRQDISDELDKLKARGSVSGGATWAYGRVSTTKENLPAVIALFGKILRQPSFDEQEFEQYKSTTKVDIEQNLQDPQSLAFNAYSKMQAPYPKGHPSYVTTYEEYLQDLESLSLDELKAFHDTFYGGANIEVAIVGDFNEPDVKKALADAFVGWQPKSEFSRVADPYQKVTPQRIEFDTPDKENATFVTGVMLPIGKEHEDAPALELGNYIFGGGFLNSRLATRLRQQDGLSYGAGSFVNMNSLDDKTTFGAYAIAAPQNLKKVEAGFKEELARMLKDGFTDEEIEAAKSGLLQGKKVSRAQDNELVNRLRGNLYLGKDMQWYKAYNAKMEKLTAKDVQQVMQKYLKVENFTFIAGGDMSKVEPVE